MPDENHHIAHLNDVIEHLKTMRVAVIRGYEQAMHDLGFGRLYTCHRYRQDMDRTPTGRRDAGAVSAPRSFGDSVRELRSLLVDLDAPIEVVDCTLRILQQVDKCLRVVPEIGPTAGALEPPICLQPSDFFLRLIAAVRALDWPKVLILEHEVSPSLVPKLPERRA